MSVKPFIGKVFYPFGAVLLKTGTYVEGVSSTLNTSDRGVLFSSIFLIITCKYDIFRFSVERFGNRNFACSAQSSDKFHPSKQALCPVGLI